MKAQKKTAPAPVIAQPQVLDVVLRQMGRAHAQALMFEHLAEYAADAFRGSDTRGPRKLLQLPNGLRCRAEEADVLELETTLRRMAIEARTTLSRFKGASVVVDESKDQSLIVPSRRQEGEQVADSAEGVRAWQSSKSASKLEPDEGEVK